MTFAYIVYRCTPVSHEESNLEALARTTVVGVVRTVELATKLCRQFNRDDPERQPGWPAAWKATSSVTPASQAIARMVLARGRDL